MRRGIRLWLLALVVVFTIAPLGATAQTQVTEVTKEGLVLPVHQDQRATYMERMEELTKSLGVDPKSHVIVVSNPRTNESWVVFTDKKPDEGWATVTGQAFPSIEIGQRKGVIFASKVSVRVEGKPVPFDDLVQNPTNYAYDIVEIRPHYRQLSYTVTVGEGEVVTHRTSGVVSPTVKQGRFVVPPGRAGRWTVLNLSAPNMSQGRRTELLTTAAADRVTTFDWSGPRYWINASTTLDAIVVPSSGGYPLRLYVTKIDVTGKRVPNPSTIAARGARYEGTVVTTEAQVVGTTISSKQLLLSVARCAPDSVTNPITGCIPVPTDTTVHAGVLFSGVPTAREDVVVYAGLSSHRQDEVFQRETGTYQVTGRVVSTSKIDPRLPKGYGLLVYEMERTGPLQASEIARSRARTWADTVRTRLRQQLISNRSEWTTLGREGGTGAPTPGQRLTATRTRAATTALPDEQRAQQSQQGSGEQTEVYRVTGTIVQYSDRGWSSSLLEAVLFWVGGGLVVAATVVGAIHGYKSNQPEYEVQTPEREIHLLWILGAVTIVVAALLAGGRALLIAFVVGAALGILLLGFVVMKIGRRLWQWVFRQV